MAYTKLMYHILFSTKERRPLITPDALPRICEYMGGIVRKTGGKMLSANGTADHLHIATISSPTITVSKLVQLIKGNSSGWIHRTFPKLRLLYWQESYAAFTVSPSALGTLLRYIGAQAEHHKTIDFKEELRALLKKHGVDYDEGHIWG